MIDKNFLIASCAVVCVSLTPSLLSANQGGGGGGGNFRDSLQLKYSEEEEEDEPSALEEATQFQFYYRGYFGKASFKSGTTIERSSGGFLGGLFSSSDDDDGWEPIGITYRYENRLYSVPYDYGTPTSGNGSSSNGSNSNGSSSNGSSSNGSSSNGSGNGGGNGAGNGAGNGSGNGGGNGGGTAASNGSGGGGTTTAGGSGMSPGECSEKLDGNKAWEIREELEDSETVTIKLPPNSVDRLCFDLISEQEKREWEALLAGNGTPEGAEEIGELQVKETDDLVSFRIYNK
jgi:hypothetical protein